MLFIAQITYLKAQSTIFVNVKVYIDDPTIVTNPVTVTEAQDLIDLVNDDILEIHDIKLNSCIQTLDTDMFDTNPDEFLNEFCSPYDDPQRLDIYLRKDGFNGIAGEARNRRLWSAADRFTFPHELGHLLGLNAHTDQGNLCLSAGIDVDGIADTPFHPDLYDSGTQTSGLPVFATDCTVNWLNVTDACGVLIIDPNLQSVLLPLYVNNIELNLMAQVYPPNCDINTLPQKGFTAGQGEFMRSFATNRLQQFTSTTTLDCNESSWTIIDTDINTDVTLSGYVVIENSIDINANVTFDNAVVILKPSVSLNFKSGSNSIFNDVNLRYSEPCDPFGLSGSITFESGSNYDINLTRFSDIQFGMFFESQGVISNTSFNNIGGLSGGVTIRDLGNLGQVNNTFILTDIISSSRINIINSRVALWGPEMTGGADIEITNGEFFTQMSPAPRRPVFGRQSRITFNSGPQLVVDNASFDMDATGSGIAVIQCQNAMICRCQFLGSNLFQDAIGVFSVNEYSIFENVFTGSLPIGISTNNSPNGLIRNNIFEDTEVSLEFRSSAEEVEVTCNFHENNETAWDLRPGVVLDTQGMVGVPAYNNFINTIKHVTNNVEFEYFFDPLNPNRLDENLADEVFLTSTAPNFALDETLDVCIERNEIIGDWATWLGCPIEDMERVSLTCAHTGCTFHIPPPIPPRIKDLGSKSSSNLGQILDNSIESNESLSSFSNSMNNVNIVSKDYIQNNIKVSPNPFVDYLYLENNSEENINVRIFDSLGRLILEKDYQVGKNRIDLSQANSGILFVDFISNSGLKTRKKIIKQ